MADPGARPGLDGLMAKLGYLLLHWGMLEDRLRRAIIRLHGDPERVSLDYWAHLQVNADFELKPRVEAIEAALEPVRRLRNLVAHGLTGASADAAKHPEPVLFCTSKEGEHSLVPLSALEAAIRVLEAQIPNVPMPQRRKKR